MASEEDRCTDFPDYAIICSFIENFGEKVKLTFPDIDELQILLEDTDNVNPLLAKLFGQLLRRINKSVKFDKWERGLQRFAHSYSHQDGWELERFGFKKAKLECKLRVFRNLLESQFDLYKSFKDKVNLISAKDLRLQPCGRDKHGVSYWCQLDKFANLRIYKDDQDDETWTLVARSREELVSLIDELQASSPPRSLARETSVEESQSEANTPVVLSEAPTPVDSKATTPVTSGRTSPVLDTGQPREKFKSENLDSMEIEGINENEIKKISLHSASEVDNSCKINKDVSVQSSEVKKNIEESKSLKLNESESNLELPLDKGGSVSNIMQMDSALENIPKHLNVKAIDLSSEPSQKHNSKLIKEKLLSIPETLLDSSSFKNDVPVTTITQNVLASLHKDMVGTSEVSTKIQKGCLGQQLKEELSINLKKSPVISQLPTKKTVVKQSSVLSKDSQNRHFDQSSISEKASISKHAKLEVSEHSKNIVIAPDTETVASIKKSDLSRVTPLQEPTHSKECEDLSKPFKDSRVTYKETDKVLENIEKDSFQDESMRLTETLEQKVPKIVPLKKIRLLEPCQTLDVERSFVNVSNTYSEVAQDLSMHSLTKQETVLNLSETKDSSNIKDNNKLPAPEEKNYLSVEAVVTTPLILSQPKSQMSHLETSLRDPDEALNLTSPRKKAENKKSGIESHHDKTNIQLKDKPDKKTIDQIFSLSKGRWLDQIVAKDNERGAECESKVEDTTNSPNLEAATDLSKFSNRSIPYKPSFSKEQTTLKSKILKNSQDAKFNEPDVDKEIKRDSVKSAIPNVISSEPKSIAISMQSSDLSKPKDVSNYPMETSSGLLKPSDSRESKTVGTMESGCSRSTQVEEAPLASVEINKHKALVAKLPNESVLSPNKELSSAAQAGGMEASKHQSILKKDNINQGSFLKATAVLSDSDDKANFSKPEQEVNKVSSIVAPTCNKSDIAGSREISDNKLCNKPFGSDTLTAENLNKAVRDDLKNSKCKTITEKQVVNNMPRPSVSVSSKKTNVSEETENLKKESSVCNTSKISSRSDNETKMPILVSKKTIICETTSCNVSNTAISLTNQEPAKSEAIASTEPVKSLLATSQELSKHLPSLSKERIKSDIISSPVSGHSVSIVSEDNKISIKAGKDPIISEYISSNASCKSISVPSKELDEPETAASKISSIVGSKKPSKLILSVIKDPIKSKVVTLKEPSNSITIPDMSKEYVESQKTSGKSSTIISKEHTSKSVPSKSEFISQKLAKSNTTLNVMKEQTNPDFGSQKENGKSLIASSEDSCKSEFFKSAEVRQSVITSEVTRNPVSIIIKESSQNVPVTHKELIPSEAIVSKDSSKSKSDGGKESSILASGINKEPAKSKILKSRDIIDSKSLTSEETSKSLSCINNPVEQSISGQITTTSDISKESDKFETLTGKENSQEIPKVISDNSKLSNRTSNVTNKHATVTFEKPIKSDTLSGKEIIKCADSSKSSSQVSSKSKLEADTRKVPLSSKNKPVADISKGTGKGLFDNISLMGKEPTIPAISDVIGSSDSVESEVFSGKVLCKPESIKSIKAIKSELLPDRETSEVVSVAGEPPKSVSVSCKESQKSVSSKESQKSVSAVSKELSKSDSVATIADKEINKLELVDRKQSCKSESNASKVLSKLESVTIEAGKSISNIKSCTSESTSTSKLTDKSGSSTIKEGSKSKFVSNKESNPSEPFANERPFKVDSLASKESSKSDPIASKGPNKSDSIVSVKSSIFESVAGKTSLSEHIASIGSSRSDSVSSEEPSKSEFIASKQPSISKLIEVKETSISESVEIVTVKTEITSKKSIISQTVASKSELISSKEPNKSESLSSKESKKSEFLSSKEPRQSEFLSWKEPGKSEYLSCKEPSKLKSILSQVPSKHISIARKEPNNSELVVSEKFGLLEPVSIKEPSNSGPITSKEPDKSELIDSKRSSILETDANKEPSKCGCLSSTVSIKSEVIADKESRKCERNESKKFYVHEIIASKQLSIVESVLSKESSKFSSSASKELSKSEILSSIKCSISEPVLGKESSKSDIIAVEELRKSESIASKIPRKSESDSSIKVNTSLSIANEEFNKSESIDPQKNIKSESNDKKEPIKSESIDRKQPCKSESIDRKEPSKSESVDRKEPSKSESICTKEPSKSESIDTKEPRKSESIIRRETSNSESIDRKEPSKSESICTKEPNKSESIDTKEPRKSDSIIRKETSNSESIDKKEPSKSESIDRKEPSKYESIVRKEHCKSESIDRKELSKSESTDRTEPSKSESIDERVPSKSESIDKKEPSKSESINRKDSSKSEYIDRKEPNKSESISRKEPSKLDCIDKKESSKYELIDRKEPCKSDSIDIKESSKSESIVRQEPSKSESIYRNEPSKSDSIDKMNPSKPEFIDRKEPSKSESIGRKESCKSDSIDKKEPSKSESIEGKEHSKSESINRKESSKSDLIAVKGLNKSESIASKIPRISESDSSIKVNTSQSIASIESSKSESIDRKEPSKSESNDKREPIKSESIDGKQSSKSESIDRKESSKSESIDRKEPSKSESIDRKEPSKSESIDTKEPRKSESIIRKESSKSESIDRQEPSKSESIDRKEPNKAESIGRKEPNKSQSIDRKEPSKSESFDRKELKEFNISKSEVGIIKDSIRSKSESLSKEANKPLPGSASIQDNREVSLAVEKVDPEAPYTKELKVNKNQIELKVEDCESGLGETIEEPLMIVTGEADGALCEGGNCDTYASDRVENLNRNCTCCCSSMDNFYNFECSCTTKYSGNSVTYESAVPWWENFQLCENSQVANNTDVIEEKVQYFWGEGNGKECDAGNSGDESENPVISKRSSRRRTRSAIKKPEILENSVEETGNAGKLNGLKNNCQSNDPIDSNKVEKNCSTDERQIDSIKVDSTAADGNKLDEDNISSVAAKDNVKAGKVSRNVNSNKVGKSDKKEVPDKSITKSVISGDLESKEKPAAHKNNQVPKEQVETNANLSEHDDKEMKSDHENENKDSAEKNRPLRGGFRGRGRPKKSQRRGVALARRSRTASHEADKEIEESSEDESERSPHKRGKGNIDIASFEEAPSQRGRSQRIAKIREREETERRELEAQRMRQMAEEHRLRELKKKARLERRALREIKKTKKEKKKDKKKKKKKKKVKKKLPPGTDPWNHSSSSSSSSSEEDELDMEEEDNEELVFKSDHEFSPESDIGEDDAQPIKRARTARKVEIIPKEAVLSEDSDYDDTQCVKCGHEDHPETILLCDSCDNGWHISCLRPPLFSVPEGDWSCPTCEHATLIEKLKEILEQFDATKKKAETEELRKQRLAYINVSLDNVIPDKKKHKHDEGSESDSDESGSDSDSGSESSSSTGTGSDSSGPALYTLRARPARTPKEQVENFDELINEAIRDEMEAALLSKKTTVGRGKDISTIVEGEKEDDAYEDEEEEEEEEKEDEEVGKGTGKEMRIEEEENARMKKKEDEKEESKETKVEEVKEEVKPNEEEKHIEDEVATPKKEVRIAEEDDEDVAPKRKKKKLNDDDEGDVGSEYELSEPESPPSRIKKKRGGSKAANLAKKRRRLTDLDVEEEEDDSDEDFMGTSDEDEEDEEASDAASSDFESESESDDSRGRGRSGRYGIVPLRRSTRNTRNASLEDYDSDDKKSKRQKKKKKKKRRLSSSEEEDGSSDSEGSYAKKKKSSKKKSTPRRSKGRRSSSKKKRGSKKPQNKKRKMEEEEDGQEKPKPKPRIKYSKPPKTKEEQQEEVSQRRVTRGRQINYYNSLLMSDEDFEDEEEKPKSRGKVMKGERVSESSSEFEISDDERKKRCGVSGGLGKGKVMKGEEEDEEYEKKKKKPSEEAPTMRGKPKSAIMPPKLPVLSADTNQLISSTPDESPLKISSEEKPITPSNPIVIKGSPSINQAPIRMTVNRPGALPTPTLIRGGGPGSRPRHPTPLQSHLEAKMYRQTGPSGMSRFPHSSQIQIATSPTPIVSGISSSVSITPVSYVPNPNAHTQSHIRPNNSVTMTPRIPSPRGPRPTVSSPTIPSHVTITRGPRVPFPSASLIPSQERISPPVSAIRGPAQLQAPTRGPSPLLTAIRGPSPLQTAIRGPALLSVAANGNRLPVTTTMSKVEIKNIGALVPPVTLANSPTLTPRSTPEILPERQPLPVIAPSVKRNVPLGRDSPGPLPPMGKWSPHIAGGNGGSSTPPHHGVAPGTPPHINVSGPINSSPPPPYRLSPIPVSGAGPPPSALIHRSTPPNLPPTTTHSPGYPPPNSMVHRSTPPNLPPSTTHPASYPPPSTIAHRGTPPNLPPTTTHPIGYPSPSTISHRSTPPNLPPTTSHPAGYPSYPPPEHFGPHPGYPPGYHPGAAHSPGPHGPPPRHNLPHPGSIPPNHPMYGPPVSHASSYQSLPPHHPGVLRGPIHELYRHSASSHPRPLLLKQGYPGLEPLPYAGSPGPIDVSGGRHNSPGPPIAAKEPQAPSNKKSTSNEGEFSSGLMSYFSSQREDDVE